MSRSSKSHALAVFTVFFVNGLTFSNWLPRLGEVRDNLGVSNGGLGLTLLGGGLGGLLGSFIVAPLMARLGSRMLLLISATTVCFVMPFIGIVGSPALLLVMLTLLGGLDVLADMAMNTQGVIAQNALGRQIMNRLHGGWSLGFVVGSGLGLIFSALDVGLKTHLISIAVIMLATFWYVQRWFEPNDPQPSGEASGGRRSVGMALIVLGLVAVAVAAAEGIPNEWGSLFLVDIHGVGNTAGIATVIGAAGLMVGRLSGDAAIERFGSGSVMRGSVAMLVIGISVAAASVNPVMTVIGLFIWGLGNSVLFPQMYARAASMPGVSAGAGLGAMGVGQRLGFMLTPVAMGQIADASNLRWSFAIVAGVSALVIAVHGLRRTPAGPSPAPAHA